MRWSTPSNVQSGLVARSRTPTRVVCFSRASAWVSAVAKQVATRAFAWVWIIPLLAAVSAQSHTNLSQAYAALGFNPSHSSNSVVVLFSDPHMNLDPSILPVTTNLDPRLVTGIPPFAYQWQLNGSPIPNATSSRYTIPTVGTNDAGGYSVVVSNDWKVLTSATAQLAIGPAAPFCLTCGFSGSNLTLTLMAEGGRTYRWLSSTDLVTWSTVTSNLAAAHGPLQLTRPMTVSRGFFRVVTP